MASEKVTAAQKRALEKMQPGECYGLMGFNTGTLDALEKRGLVTRGYAALSAKPFGASAGRYHLSEAFAITAAGYTALTGKAPSADVAAACEKAAASLVLGVQAHPSKLRAANNQVHGDEGVVALRKRAVDNQRARLVDLENDLKNAEAWLARARQERDTIKAARKEAVSKYEALTGVKLIAGVGVDAD
jgi:hypothetical protein